MNTNSAMLQKRINNRANNNMYSHVQSLKTPLFYYKHLFTEREPKITDQIDRLTCRGGLKKPDSVKNLFSFDLFPWELIMSFKFGEQEKYAAASGILLNQSVFIWN